MTLELSLLAQLELGFLEETLRFPSSERGRCGKLDAHLSFMHLLKDWSQLKRRGSRTKRLTSLINSSSCTFAGVVPFCAHIGEKNEAVTVRMHEEGQHVPCWSSIGRLGSQRGKLARSSTLADSARQQRRGGKRGGVRGRWQGDRIIKIRV